MKIGIPVFLFLLSCAFLKAQDSVKTFTAVRISSAPKIDGVMDDEAWKTAAPFSDFVQKVPIEGATPRHRTEVSFVYDDFAIYVGAFMYDDRPDSILHELGFRDDDNLNADRFRVVFDPYNTRQDGFNFEVWASGVQHDYKFSDYTFDAVWKSAVKIGDKGWCVEMCIPYSAIRFPAQKTQKWAIQVTRDIRRTREFYQACLTPSKEANFMKFFGNLVGIENIDPPLRLSLTPYLSAYADRSPFYYNATSYLYANTFTLNYGADIKYGIDERFTVDMTLLPDFGQVQSDPKVKNLSYREINYDENRPFFKEGTELFSKNQLFYSRRIGKTPTGFYDVPYLINPSEKIVSNPSKVRLLNATKLTGRTDKGLGIGVMNAVTANMYAEIQDTVTGETRKILTEPLVNYNVLVLDQQLKNNSNIWFMNTNVMRDKGFDDVNMSSAGYTLFNKKNTLASDGNFALSQNYSEDTAAGVNTVTDKIGYSYFLGVRKTGGNFEYGVGHEVFNNTFERRDLGYFAINNYSSFNYYLAFHQFQPWKFLRSSYMGMNFHHSNSFTTRELTGMSFNLDAFHTALSYFAFYYGVNVSPASTYDYFEPRVPGRYYRRCQTWYSWAGISTDYRKKVALDLGSHITNFFSDNAQHLPDLVGYGINPSIRYRVNDKLTVKYSMEYAYDPYNDGFADIDVNGDIIFGGRKLVTFVNGLNVKYIFMNDMSLSFNARHYWNTGEYQDYFTLGEFGWLLPNDTYTGNRNFNYNAFNIDMVYSWQFAPGSLLTLVYKNAIETESPIIIRKFSDDLTQTLQSPQTNGVSLKLLYYLDYQYLKKKK